MRKLIIATLILLATFLKGQDTLFIPIRVDTIKENGTYFHDTKGLINNTTYIYIRVKFIISTPQDTGFIRPKGFKQL